VATGNYVISGGSETVLVIWQLDTGKKQFLPHMSATIQSLVISPSGSSYGVRLADNSTMVLSTAELLPTANIAGIQACVIEPNDPDGHVQRLADNIREAPLVQRTPVVISPMEPSRMLLGVGQTQKVHPRDTKVLSVPYLQTFDLASGHNISRQALTRSNITNVNIAPGGLPISEPRITHMQISYDGSWLATVDQWIPPKRDVEFLGHQGMDLGDERRRRLEVFLKFWQWNKEGSLWELVSRIDAPHESVTPLDGPGKVLDLAADPSSLRFTTIGEDGVVRTWTPKTRKRDGIVVRGQDGKPFRNWTCQHAVSLTKPEIEETGNRQSTHISGSVAFSEDGSIIAAAYGGEDGLLHLLDPDIGSIRLSLTGMFEGDVIRVDFVGQVLVTLSDILLVYDVVSEEIIYSIKLGASITSLSIEQKVEMMHLAVDRRSQTFAVALPARIDSSHVKDGWKRSLLSRYSELAIFSRDDAQPLLRVALSTLVTALLPAVGSDGYFVLDTAAEVRTLLQKGSQSVTSLAQSTSALHLDAGIDEPVGGLLGVAEEVDDTMELDEAQHLAAEGTLDDNDDDETPVVTQQQLSEIFDVGPAFALPPMEEMFYQVAGLFSSKPLSQSV